MLRKVCVVTGTRAEYGLLHGLLKEIELADELQLQLIVTGMHLSHEFGNTYQQIAADGFRIDAKVEMLLSSDTEVGISKSMGLAMLGFADVFADLQPDILVVLGDRFEIFSAVSVATIARLPIAHLHGGETTEGAFDESFRHSISKMSHLHFTATEVYRQRVIQLGEHPERVFNVGAIGIDNVQCLALLTRQEFEKSIGFNLAKRNFLITFHPVTLENATSEEQLDSLLIALDELEDAHFIFTKANSDTNGRVINKMLADYVRLNSDKAILFDSLGLLRYLSSMQYMDAVVGNSSSGLIEAPSFKVATINIGDRQRGRVKADSVIDCCPDVPSIRTALNTLYSNSFQGRLKTVKNPYGKGNVAKKIVDVLSSYDLNGILKKKFYDME